KINGRWHGLLQRDEEGYRRRAGRDFLHYTSADSPLHFWNELLNDKTMDHGIVALVRLATYQYAIENEDMEVGGMPLSEAALASSDAKTFNEWLDRNVRTDEQEAGSLAMMLAASALNVRFLAVKLDRDMKTPLQRLEFLPVGRSAPKGPDERWDAILLSKPGHYDVLYESPVGEELFSLQNENNVIENCSYWRCKPKCPICRCDIETYEDVLCGVSPDCAELFHRCCFKSMVDHDSQEQSGGSSSHVVVRCPVCRIEFTEAEVEDAISGSRK
ncbi:hypothetical protein Pmar_PMAR010763, partial [Perkinsus marinus ATCC 50983]